MPLSDTTCRNAKAREKPYKLTDGEGMHLLVQPNGSRLWRLSYRFAGKQKTLALGIYPAVGLGSAREKRMAARKLLANGVDPNVARKALNRAAAYVPQRAFESVAREWLSNEQARWVPAHSTRILSRLEHDVFPALGFRPIDESKHPKFLKRFEPWKREAPSMWPSDLDNRAERSSGTQLRLAGPNVIRRLT